MIVNLPRPVYDILIPVVKRIKSESYVKKVYLYGSYCKGNYNEESDLDIAVFIDESKISIYEEYKRIAYLCLGYAIDIQPQVFSYDELCDPIGIVEEITENGVELV